MLGFFIEFFYPTVPLHVITLEPEEFKVDATHTCWVSHSRWAYALNMQNTIRKFKYRLRGIDPLANIPELY